MSFLSDIHSTAAAAATVAGAIVSGKYVWSSMYSPEPLLMSDTDYENQSKLVDEGNDAVRMSQFKNPEVKRGNFSNIKTLYDIFQCGLYHGKDSQCLAYKPPGINEYTWLTYSEVDDYSMKTGAGIIGRLNQLPGQNTMLGIFMRNCVEWVYIEQSCSRYSMIAVPLYDTLGEDACKFIINNVKCEVIFVDTKKKIDFLLGCRNKLPHLKYIIAINTVSDDTVSLGRQNNIEILRFSEILAYGAANPVPLNLPKPTDTYTIFFTSGTTGTPKGCVISHASVLATIGASLPFTDIIKFGSKQETHLSFLPLTHVYERMVHSMIFMFTGRIFFFSDDIRNLMVEFQVVQPTIIFAVPRLLNRIYDKVMTRFKKGSVLNYIFEKGLSVKSLEVERGITRRNSFWDYIMFKKIQETLGGKVEIVFVGSAPVSENVLKFFRSVMGCIVLEGYGQTETTGPCTMTIPGDNATGHVGPPLAGVQIKLCDVPDLDIVVARDGRGEICVKGESCIKEYYDNQEMTAKLIDADGWLHTGDVGLWTSRGQLSIVDRSKHIFKLAQGEYLAPERLENVYCLSPLVLQIFVTGNSFKEYCVAIVVPDIEGWMALDRGYTSTQDICNDKESNEILLKNLEEVGRKNKLMGFEIVKRVMIWPNILTIEDGLLTPTFKLKRAEVSKYFSSYIDGLYD